VSVRENLRSKHNLLGSGEDGMKEAIKQFAVEYAADITLLPSEWEITNAKQSVAHYGGYLNARKDIDPDYIVANADTIHKKRDELAKHLTASAEDIKAVIADLEVKITAENVRTAKNRLVLGDTGEKLARDISTMAYDLAAAMEVAQSPKMWARISEAKQVLENITPKATVVDTVMPTSAGAGV
jgi:hypothetical protein